ncbi:PREDICTED: leucine-rich PPR motif-containing protein, mitochondrial isoform X2 [Nicrophorus vespilloides]|uniref:Leucine-rich PPR motif-containing protein, mitochondrial isoform X2 n=1 Tax=Nicrophorus vespilloides TaxID=110193 RepID=A0ABM1MLY9_NICVS|nr:PREDICTED: leucine-rich PPR motif-containing protein, mitochondrial isoform X2 [Nicrophorus vespilloides]
MSLANSSRYVTRFWRVYRGYSRPNLKQQINSFCALTKTNENEDPINLLWNCGHQSYNESLSERINKLQRVWRTLNTSELELCKAYLKVSMENEMSVDHKEFLTSLKCKPDEEILVLLLEAVCMKGDVQSAVDVLAEMKLAGVAVDERIFNALLLAHIIKGGMEHGRSVLKTMKTAHIEESENTKWMMLKGLAQNNSLKEFVDVLGSMQKLQFNESRFFDLLTILGSRGHHLWINDFVDFIGVDSISKVTLSKLEPVCVQLVHRKCPEAAFHIYKLLINPENIKNYGSNLLREMINAEIPIETVIEMSKSLIENELNPQALIDVTETALRKGLVKESLLLFRNLDTVRPHFFWPLIKIRGGELGEAGAIEMMDEMQSLDVVLDYDTLEYYLLPYCDISNPNFFMQRVKLKRKEILTPLVSLLLKQGNIKGARDMSQLDAVDSARLLKPLSDAWKKHRESTLITEILQKICECAPVSSDHTGTFLLRCLKTCKTGDDYDDFFTLAETVRTKRLTVSSLASEDMTNNLKFYGAKCNCKDDLYKVLDKLIDIAKNESLHIEHPRDMGLEDLECHLQELTNKGMETRGVIRKMIQLHASKGNYKRVQELRDLFKESGYVETAGMKSSLLHVLVKSGELNLALEVYKDIKNSQEDFEIDSFKAIDLVTLLLQTGGNVYEAIDILKIEAKVNRTRGSLDRNCWKMLNQAQSPEDALKLFECIIESGYCQVNNMILGPIARSFLKQGDFKGAVEFYCKCTQEYKCTPLQMEMFLVLIEAKEQDLINTVYEATIEVHGSYGTQISFASALAQKGLEKPLAKFLVGMKRFRDHDLDKRCEKWIYENKMLPMKTLALASRRITSQPIKVSIIHSAVLKLYSKTNDCEGALGYLKELENNDMTVDSRFYEDLNRLLTRCNFQVPKYVADKC